MPEPSSPGSSRDAVARVARALGVADDKVKAAFAAAGLTPDQAFNLIVHGEGEAKVAALAKELHVSRARLALALLDQATQAVSSFAQEPAGLGERVSQAAGRAAQRAKEWTFEVVEFILETFAETVPRFLNRVTLVLALTGVVFASMGILALVSPELFLKIVYYVVGALLVAFGAGMLWLAWKIHEATATLRTLARLARKWRSRWHSWRGDEA